MTVKQARKILGKDSSRFSDKEIEKLIEMATFFKDIFYSDELFFKNKCRSQKPKSNNLAKI